ncbi:MAG: ABC transporter ATP-binding protein [Bryobacterales bacterium]|nr:ABC transporter ATP-binding protein [Bryobacterales bacterium]
MNPLIQMEGVSKIYGEGACRVHALRHADVEVRAGEVLILRGPSGSGKTTLLSIMGAILRPTSGSVRIGGQEIAHRKESELPRVRLQYIGFVFQGFNLFPALPAMENVALAAKLKGASSRSARQRALELLRTVGLEDQRDRLPADLSGGQKQRVAIARALAGDPKIILADEPTAALDSVSGITVMEMLASLAKEEGRAVVVVTHDSRLLRYATRVVDVEDGIAAERREVFV